MSSDSQWHCNIVRSENSAGLRQCLQRFVLGAAMTVNVSKATASINTREAVRAPGVYYHNQNDKTDLTKPSHDGTQSTEGYQSDIATRWLGEILHNGRRHVAVISLVMGEVRHVCQGCKTAEWLHFSKAPGCNRTAFFFFSGWEMLVREWGCNNLFEA